jgi:hypothetical protein
MAFAGALIVMTGLAVLSFVISQLHKIVTLLERPKSKKTKPLLEQVAASPVSIRFDPSDLAETEKRYRSITVEMQEPFELSELYKVAARHAMPHPHLSIRNLREAGIIVPAGDGRFTWK